MKEFRDREKRTTFLAVVVDRGADDAFLSILSNENERRALLGAAEASGVLPVYPAGELLHPSFQRGNLVFMETYK